MCPFGYYNDNQEGYMLAKVLPGALLGIDAYPVEVEACL